MADVSNDKSGAECMMCHCDSQERALISVLFKSEDEWVCVGCLPMLIHGAH
ncbi:MAG: hypothetical protein Q7R39_14220 [Dehalococcoidia bacterium]|nr:hypothetical protein [Dehalococcoidia bacterium]